MATISTATATDIATARAAQVRDLIPSQYRGDADAVLTPWVAAAGTDGETAAAQAVVDAGAELATARGSWALADSILSVLFVETDAAERWTTSSGRRFGAQGWVRETPAAPAQSTAPAASTEAPATDEEITDAALMGVLVRIADAAERIATALED